MKPPCLKCGGWVEESGDPDTDYCRNCGGRVYNFVPDPILPRRATRAARVTRSPVPGQIREVLIQFGGPMHLRHLEQLMRLRYNIGPRYVRSALSTNVWFKSLGKGTWVLDEDFENE